MEDRLVKDPGVAAVLSFVFSGLGQLYNGQIAKGLWMVFFSVLLLLSFLLSAVVIGFQLFTRSLPAGLFLSSLGVFCLSILSIGVLGVYSIFDAYRQAEKK